MSVTCAYDAWFDATTFTFLGLTSPAPALQQRNKRAKEIKSKSTGFLAGIPDGQYVRFFTTVLGVSGGSFADIDALEIRYVEEVQALYELNRSMQLR